MQRTSLRYSVSVVALVAAMWGFITASAQTFTAISPYDTINFNGDTLRFNFTGLPAGAWGMATLRLFFEGDDGDNSEFLDAYGEGLAYLGRIGPHPSRNDCAPEDSVDVIFPASQLVTWNANGSVDFIMVPSSDVDQFCTNNRGRVRLIFNYCSFGTPAQIAQVSAQDSTVCPLDGPQTLTGIPLGGVFSGPGVSGSTFDPIGLAAGDYTVRYTATDSIGCTTYDELDIRVFSSPSVSGPLVACPGASITIAPAGSLEFVWFADAGMTQVLDTAPTFTTPNLFQTTTYYVASLDADDVFRVDTMLSANSATIDHNLLGGDDRGGIAVTPQHVFVNCDNNCVRYNLNLGAASGISLPRRDGIVSDLRSGKLWTLWDGTTDPQNAPSNFNAIGLRGMDSTLSFTGEYLLFDAPINLGNNQNYTAILAGYGHLGLYSGNAQRWYVVDMDNGIVQDLGPQTNPQFYGSENWAIWGILEGDCAQNFRAVYRTGLDDNVKRTSLPAATFTNVGVFPSGVSDMASLTFSPWNNRWYFHYEGSSGTFGGSSETLGYADATATYGPCPGGLLGCHSEFVVTVPTVNIGPNDTICSNETATFFAGTGFSSYTWNGVNTNFNLYTISTAGPVYFEGMHISTGCTVRDTAIVMVTAAPVADFTPTINGLSVSFADNSSGTPVSWSWDFGDGNTSPQQNPTHSYAVPGAYTVCLTVTNAAGCSSTFCDRIYATAVAVIGPIGGNVTVFPNPASDKAMVSIRLEESDDASLRLSNLLGVTLWKKELVNVSEAEIELDLSHLSAGIYLLNVRTSLGNSSMRLAVER